MRNLLFFALIAMSLVFTNCKKDPVSSDPMVGKWKLDNIYMKNGKNTVTDGIDILEYRLEMQGKNLSAQVELKADGTYTSTGSYTASYDFYDGLDLFLHTDIVISPFATGGTYSRTGNIFKATDSTGQSSEATIVSETSDLLTLEVSYSQSQNQGGLISTSSGTIVEVLKRQ
jgi:hypothetical protein